MTIIIVIMTILKVTLALAGMAEAIAVFNAFPCGLSHPQAHSVSHSQAYCATGYLSAPHNFRSM
jgi:hypothetical protein